MGRNQAERNPLLIVSILVVMMGFAPLWNAISKPAVQTLRTVDIVGLIAAGFCFGAAFAFGLASRLVSRPGVN